MNMYAFDLYSCLSYETKGSKTKNLAIHQQFVIHWTMWTMWSPMPGENANTLKAKRAETCKIPGAGLFFRVGAAAEKLYFLRLMLLVFWATLKHVALCPSLWQGGLKLVWVMWVCFLSCPPCYHPCHFLFFIFIHCCIFFSLSLFLIFLNCRSAWGHLKSGGV